MNTLLNYPKLMKEWHPTKNKKLNPGMITHGSHIKIWWKCENGHVWKSRVDSRCIYGAGCPLCRKNKTEQKVREIFEFIFKVSFPSKRPSWLKNPQTKCNLELDGYNRKLKLAFEYDGIWHDRKFPSKNATSLAHRKYLDRLKDKLCVKKGITLIRVHHSVSNYRKYIRDILKSKGIL